MNADELMIGDLVTVTTPDGSKKTKAWGRREDISIYPAIEPIEITGEFLEKNGFRLVKDCTSRWSRDIGRKTVYVTKPEGEGSVDLTFPTLHGFRRVVSDLPVTYVHQLQQICRICRININWES